MFSNQFYYSFTTFSAKVSFLQKKLSEGNSLNERSQSGKEFFES